MRSVEDRVAQNFARLQFRQFFVFRIRCQRDGLTVEGDREDKQSGKAGQDFHDLLLQLEDAADLGDGLGILVRAMIRRHH